jgi:hypothetical protein
LEVVNSLDCGFELARQLQGFLESGAIAGEELFEAAFAAQEGVKARFEEFTFEVAFVRDEVFERGRVRCHQRVDQPDGFAVVGEDQGEVGLVASNEVFFEVVKAIDVLADVALDGFGEVVRAASLGLQERVTRHVRDMGLAGTLALPALRGRVLRISSMAWAAMELGS